jgi:outer membrane protein OmpA-like peptidoglycan-associated protein
MTTQTQTFVKTEAKSLNADRSGLLQRKCDCGNSASLTGQCSKCQSEQFTQQPRSIAQTISAPVSAPVLHELIQPKLRVGAPGDKYEQEADWVADQVMRMPEPKLQRLCTKCNEELQRQPQEAMLQAKTVSGESPLISLNLQNRITALQGGGQPIPQAERAFFEPRFGADFSQVRVHRDQHAAETACDLNARAFTVGKDVVFGAGQYSPETSEGKKLLAHELTHVVQQGGAASRTMRSEETHSSTAVQRNSKTAGTQVAEVIQRAGDPAAIPPGLRCPTDLTASRPAGTDVLFSVSGSTITPAHTTLLSTFLVTWLASGGTDDILVHGYASTDGDQGSNWTLSCDRAESVRAELIRLGIPSVRISVVAHGESTDFGASNAPNRHAVVSTRAAGILPLPLVLGVLNPVDNFASRSTTRFGVGEVINLDFASLPPRPAADFGGLQWFHVSGGGALTGVTNAGTAIYTAPATADAVQLELRVATGATAGRVISTHTIAIVIPNGVRMTEVPGTAPSFANPGVVPVGTWGAGFQANVFVDPKDVSFQGIVFGEGTVISVVTPAGSFQSPFAGLAHPVNTFGPGHAGNAITGTPVSPPVDNITTGQLAPTGTLLGLPTCGVSDFLWAIPWEFSVAGGPRTPFAGGATANHHATSTFFCNATIEKAGAGPFCRRINGTTC